MRAIALIITGVLFMGCQSQQTNKEEISAQAATGSANQEQATTFVLPDGFMGSSPANEYVVYSDSVERHNGRNVSTIKAINPVKFATIISSIKPEKCIGQRIRYTAWVRSKDVAKWAGLWLRVDPVDPAINHNLGFDNMQGRPIKGTTDWTKCVIVLDVPEGAANIVYGALLDGHGQVWVDSMNIEIVDKFTPRTDTFFSKKQKVL